MTTKEILERLKVDTYGYSDDEQCKKDIDTLNFINIVKNAIEELELKTDWHKVVYGDYNTYPPYNQDVVIHSKRPIEGGSEYYCVGWFSDEVDYGIWTTTDAMFEYGDIAIEWKEF